MFNLEKKFVLERLSLERRRNGYCDTIAGLSMGISDEIEVATIVIDETIKFGNRHLPKRVKRLEFFFCILNLFFFYFSVFFVFVAQARL